MQLDASTTAVIKRVVREHFRQYAPQYAMAFALMAVFAACTAASAWLMKDVVNRIFVEQDRRAMVWIPLVIAAIFIAKGLAAYFQEVQLARIGNRLVAQTQNRLFRHILKMDSRFFQERPSSELVASMTQRVNALREMLNLLALGLGRDLMTLCSLFVVMVSQDAVMTLLALVVGPLAAIALRWLSRRIKQAATSELHSITTIITTTREAAQGYKIVKSFQLEPVLDERMSLGVAAIERISNRITRIQAMVNPLIETLGGVAVASVVFYAGWRTMSQNQTPGEFFAFITALLMAADPLRRLSRLQLQVAAASVGVKFVYGILDTPTAEDHSPRPPLEITRGEVRFEDVSFAYVAGMPVLRDLSLIARPGETTALVGLSGSGKSTVFNLLQRLWLPTSGRILIDDQPLGDVSLASVRNSISLVSQDVFLFEGTVRENIAAGLHATDAKIIEAARAAQIDTFIRGLPKGYDSLVGELGGLLSGGQRQRISIARAFLKDAPIILLDEPTSALDSETEALIQKALSELTRGRTTIVIAHRLSTIRNADTIHVLSHGELVECGDHAMLLKRGGAYARLYRSQFAEAMLSPQIESQSA